MIGQIIRSLGGYAKSYIDAKTAVKITKAEIKKKQLTGGIDWKQSAIWASKGSYKDEAWMIVFILILAGNLSPLFRTPWREDLPTFRRLLVGSVGNVCFDCRQLWNKNDERFDQMKDNFMKCLEMLLEHEGGFTADKRDPGNKGDWHGNQGSTNLGMTAHVLAEWTGKPAPIEVMKTLTAETIAPLYKAGYWDAVRGDDLASGLDWACFDWCANSGSRRSTQALQRIASAKPDGKIGPKTLQKIADNDSAILVEKLYDSRQNFMKAFVPSYIWKRLDTA